MLSLCTARRFIFPNVRMDGMVYGSVTVSLCTLPSAMVVEVNHCPGRDRVWRTSVPRPSLNVTEARVTAIIMKPKPPSGWCRSRTTSSSSDRSSKRSRLVICSAEYLGAKCASAIEHHHRFYSVAFFTSSLCLSSTFLVFFLPSSGHGMGSDVPLAWGFSSYCFFSAY